MSSMFNGATSFNQDISDWERTDGQSLPSGNGTATSTSSLGNVNYAESMFEGAINFDQDISGWDLSTPVGKNSSTNTGRYKMFLNSGIMNNNTNWWEKMPRFKPDNYTTICLAVDQWLFDTDNGFDIGQTDGSGQNTSSTLQLDIVF